MKKHFYLILVSKLVPKKEISSILGHFGSHFERRPLLWISRILKIFNVLLLFYYFFLFVYVTGILTSKSIFFLILVSKLWPKTASFVYIRALWRSFWKTPSIENLQNFEFILRAIAFYCFCVSNWYSDVKKQFFPHFIVQIMTKYDNFCLL